MFPKETYVRRRQQLAERVSRGGLILLPANGEAPANYPNNAYHFRQDSTFLYFFGLQQPGYVGLIDADTGETTLYGDDVTMDDIIWMGPQPTVREQAAQVGVARTAPLADLQETLTLAVRRGRPVHFLPPYRAERTLGISRWLGLRPEAVADHISIELAMAVVSLREAKDPDEIAELERAAAIGYEMHTTAMRMCRPGIVEREIAGAIEGVALARGAGVSFASIVSQHGETLHNHNHDGVLEAGRLLLVDAGAETTMHYCSDYTRTMPVSGRFTERQKDVYNIVLAANDRAFELSRPDAFYKDIHLEAARVLTRGLKDLGLMQGDVDDAVAAGAYALFMPHGIGHSMGLDVHDMEDIGERYVGYDLETQRSTELGLSSLRIGRRLRPGFVMTVEPGLYFIPAYMAKWKREGLGTPFINFAKAEEYLDFGGIRIEDNILITPVGNRMLGERRAPATVAGIEEWMARDR
ncbi:MAG: aminopeptidase P family protein [Rikenellaceae bacterium]|nr:aminopeptidase P family protein [Rikenellaceae bacterium]